MSPEALRVPPHSIEAEQSVIGALLLDNRVFDKLGELRADEFYKRRASVHFRGHARCLGGRPDVRRRHGQRGIEGHRQAGIRRWSGVHRCAAKCGSKLGNAARYALIVRERAKLRGLAAVGAEVRSLDSRLTSALMSDCRGAGAHRGTGGARHDDGVPAFADALATAADRSTDPTRRALQGLMPNADLERIMGGCRARKPDHRRRAPERWKVGIRAASDDSSRPPGYASAFFSGEMPAEQLAMRALAAYSECPAVGNPRRQGQHEIRADQRCHVQAGRAANQG